ncbi:MAG: DUF1549 domain-containing protein [Planctomycetota bacterium]|nr:DUF1549 domain-containing protein [Planctomycetota bacterium]
MRNSLTAFVTFASLAVAGLPPACGGEALHVEIDRLIEATAGGKLANQSSDSEFLRRVTLDLAGRVPTTAETVAFLADNATKRRNRLVDRLLASPDFPRRMQEWFQVVVLERRAEKSIKQEDWSRWVQAGFRDDVPWNQLVSRLLFVEKEDAANQPASKFLKATGRGGNSHQVTQDIARIFLGRDIMCAQCHNHPTVETYTQADYFGIFSYVQEQPAKANSEFESVFDPGKKTTGPRLPGGVAIEVPKFEKGQEAEAAKFRPRLMLARDLPSESNPAFVRTSVNRMWAMLMGRGLVHPPHLDHPDNPPSHPELFTLLQREFTTSKFNTRQRLREIALSKAYQRSSQLPEGVAAADVPDDRYRVALPKPLSPEQLAWSLMIATGNRDRMLAGTVPADEPFDAYSYINGRIERLPATIGETMELFSWMIGNPPGENPDDYNPAMGHALFLMNERLVLDWLTPRDKSLIARLVAIDKNPAAVEQLYLSVLSRPPSDDESKAAILFLDKHADSRPTALSDLAWSLLASAEFRLNH